MPVKYTKEERRIRRRALRRERKSIATFTGTGKLRTSSDLQKLATKKFKQKFG